MKLRQLRANKSSFKTVDFADGLNLVLANRGGGAAVTDTRNGIGKSTLLQAIDFCLGGSIKQKDSLAKLRNSDWEFELTAEFDGGRRLNIARGFAVSGVNLSGDLAGLGFEPDQGRSTVHVGVRAWTDWLGSQSFHLPMALDRGEYAPSFRRLVGHFLRFRDDAYIDPFETFAKQRGYQREIDNAFLLGLDWRLGELQQELKDRSASFGKMRMEEVAERLSELESRRASGEAQQAQLTRQLDNFEVLPEYRVVEERANALTSRMQVIANSMIIDSELLGLYESRLEVEDTPQELVELADLFEEAGVLFPDGVKRSLDDVRHFRSQVVRNRQEYLNAEIRRIRLRHAEQQSELSAIEAERSRELSMLRSHGALDDFTQLQRRAGELASALKGISASIDELRAVRKGKAAVQANELELQRRVEIDFDERISTVAPIMARFNEIFEQLYDAQGDLVVDPSASGYKFKVSIPRQGSHGLGKVSIFAYDICVAERWAQRSEGLGFLAHDSIVFDGVDERQTAGSIALAAVSADRYGYQYLLTINSDDLPRADLGSFSVDPNKHVILELSDETEDGGLLGIRL